MSNMLGHTCKYIQRLLMVLVCAGVFAVSSAPTHAQQGQILRVCATSCGWATTHTPYTNLHSALDDAQPDDQIWVAAGTYIPTNGCSGVHPLECSFDLREDVKVYGNFCGDELDDDLDVRDPLNNQCVTILDGEFIPQSDDGRVLHVVRAREEGFQYIDGFTIQNGNARGWTEVDSTGLPVGSPPGNGSAGGGMLVVDGHTAIIMCKFVGNSAGGSECWCADEEETCCTWEYKMFRGQGGGLAFMGASTLNRSAIVQNCVFTDNIAMRGTMPSLSGYASGPQGGAIYKSAGSGPLTIMNSVFYDNVVDASEPGSCSCDCCPPIVFDWQASGGAFAQGEELCGSTTSGTLMEIWNCTIYGNTLIATASTAARGSGIFGGYGTGILLGPIVRNTIVRENKPLAVNDLQNQIFDLQCTGKAPMNVHNSNVQGGWMGTGDHNIDANPLFSDTSSGNFRLTAGSPCIDTGLWLGIPKDQFNIARTGLTYLPVPDLDLQPRVAGCYVDMGAYEYLDPPSVAIPADLNRDCCVDFQDILILLNHWGPCADLSNCPSDLNGSGTVDFSDLILMLAAYGEGANCPSGLLPIETMDDCFERIGLENIEALAACIEAMMTQE